MRRKKCVGNCRFKNVKVKLTVDCQANDGADAAADAVEGCEKQVYLSKHFQSNFFPKLTTAHVPPMIIPCHLLDKE